MIDCLEETKEVMCSNKVMSQRQRMSNGGEK